MKTKATTSLLTVLFAAVLVICSLNVLATPASAASDFVTGEKHIITLGEDKKIDVYSGVIYYFDFKSVRKVLHPQGFDNSPDSNISGRYVSAAYAYANIDDKRDADKLEITDPMNRNDYWFRNNFGPSKFYVGQPYVRPGSEYHWLRYEDEQMLQFKFNGSDDGSECSMDIKFELSYDLFEWNHRDESWSTPYHLYKTYTFNIKPLPVSISEFDPPVYGSLDTTAVCEYGNVYQVDYVKTINYDKWNNDELFTPTQPGDTGYVRFMVSMDIGDEGVGYEFYRFDWSLDTSASSKWLGSKPSYAFTRNEFTYVLYFPFTLYALDGSEPVNKITSGRVQVKNPVVGEEPSDEGSIFRLENMTRPLPNQGSFDVSKVTWLTDDTTFRAGKTYTAMIALHPNEKSYFPADLNEVSITAWGAKNSAVVHIKHGIIDYAQFDLLKLDLTPLGIISKPISSRPGRLPSNLPDLSTMKQLPIDEGYYVIAQYIAESPKPFAIEATDGLQDIVVTEPNTDFAFEVTPKNAKGEVTYLWQACDKDGNVTDASIVSNGKACLMFGISEADKGKTFYYKCTAVCGDQTASLVFSAKLDVAYFDLTINYSETNISATVGDSVKLVAQTNVDNMLAKNLSVVWYRADDAKGTNAAIVKGAITPTLTVPTDKAGTSYYCCVVSCQNELGEYSNIVYKNGEWVKVSVVDKYTFVDVGESEWYYADITYVTQKGLMNGMGGNYFAPQGETNRAMIVTILWRLEGSPVMSGKSSFKDVDEGIWYTDAVKWAAKNNIVNGYPEDGSFRPTIAITREQVAAILRRYAKFKGWTDGKVVSKNIGNKYSSWAKEDVLFGSDIGLFNGIGKDINDLTGSCDRSEIAAYLHRFCDKFKV